MRTRLLTQGRALFLALTLIALWAHPSSAGTPIHGAKAAGMSTAFIGLADDPSAIFHNPAGITQLEGTRIYSGFSIVDLDSTFSDTSGNREDTKDQLFFPPHFFFTYQPPGSTITYGVGMTSPFGIGGRKWSRSGLTRYLATEGSISTVAITPTIAARIAPSFSVGLGIDYQHTLSVNEMMLDQSAFGEPDGRLRLEGEGGGWGWNVGGLWQVTSVFRAGLTFRSGIDADIDGDVQITDIAPALQGAFGGPTFKTSADTTLHFPEIYGMGFAFEWSGRWTLALDTEYVRWSSFDRIFTDFGTEVPPLIVDGYAVPDWEDQWLLKIGLEFPVSERVALRGGYTFIQTPVPDHTIEAGNPDSDQHYLSLGFGHQGKRWTTDAYVSVGVYEDRKVDNIVNGMPQQGEYDSDITFAGVSLGYRF